MHNIKTNFDKILEVVKYIIGDRVNEKGNYLRWGTAPRFSDVEVVALSLFIMQRNYAKSFAGFTVLQFLKQIYLQSICKQS